MAALAHAALDPGCPFAVVVVLADRDCAAVDLARARGLEADVVPARGLDRAEHEAQLTARLRVAGAEVVACAGYLRVFTAGFVEAWAGRLVNIHPSLLPMYPGLRTHARALADGVRESGCTVHLVSAEVDAGPVLAQARVPVLAGDDAAALGARVLAAEHRLYPVALAGFVRGLAGSQ